MNNNKILTPTPRQVEWADCEFGVIIHLDLQSFDPGYDAAHPAGDSSGRGQFRHKSF